MGNPIDRRTVLRTTGVAVALGVSGCLSEPGNSTATETPDTTAPSRTTQHTRASPTPPPAHPVDLLLENNSDNTHQLSIRITDTSETVFLDEQYTLESREERTVPNVMPAPSGEQVTYTVKARLETGQEASEQITVQIPADLHLLSVFVTSDDEVAIDRVVH